MPRVLLEATLTDESGNPLNGKTISFYYRSSVATSARAASQSATSTDWTYIGSSTTDSNGKASITKELDPGVYDFRAYFPGDEKYESSEAMVLGYEVSKIKTKLTLTVTVVG